MTELETKRLTLRRLTPGDAAFVFELVNDPDWIRFIGDRDVHNLDDARSYIANGPVAMYGSHGFGLLLVASKEDSSALGICGLIKRDALLDVDLGFAFLPRARGLGLATEAAEAVLRYGDEVLGLPRIVAITSQDNYASIRVLERLGFRFETLMRMPGEDEDVKLFARKPKAG